MRNKDKELFLCYSPFKLKLDIYLLICLRCDFREFNKTDFYLYIYLVKECFFFILNVCILYRKTSNELPLKTL